MKKLPLAERAELARKIARESRTLAAGIIRNAETWERNAALMDQGIDPFLPATQAQTGGA